MGKVYLIGAGPGAPDLITLRGAKILERAEVVFYDALVHPDIVALAAGARKIQVGKRGGRISTDQRFINRALVKAGMKFGVVARLKGGDPMLFGRAQEEMAALAAAGIECEIVPGVTSALAAAADLGVPLTRRGISRSVVFATPRTAKELEAGEWARQVAQADTAVLYMGVGQAGQIAAALLAQGLSPATPVAVVENASLPGMRSFRCTLAELPQATAWKQAGPALIMLGEVFRQEDVIAATGKAACG